MQLGKQGRVRVSWWICDRRRGEKGFRGDLGFLGFRRGGGRGEADERERECTQKCTRSWNASKDVMGPTAVTV